ncbi:MAG: hypothetical protein PUE55_02200 [Bacteroidales bacterium]|nr:hypothetical protein [Bacteroidales bacterium]
MDLQTILSWFKRGCKPTEAQFEATFRSFRHKDDAIPMGDVAGLAYTLANKSDKGHTHTLAEISDYDGGDKEVINAMVAEDSAELDAFAKTEGMYYILLSEHLLYQYLYDADTDTYALAETEPDGQVVYSAMDADENVHIYIYNVPQLTFQDVTNDQVDKTIYTNNLDSLITKQLPNGVYSVVYVNSGIDNNMYGDAYTLTVGDGSMFGRILECRSGWAKTVLLDEVYQWEWNHYSYRGHTHEIADVSGLQEKLDSITYGYTGGNTKSVVTYDSYGNFPTIGDRETLYIASDTNMMYAWSGTRYVQIGGNESNSVHFYNYDDIEQVDELPDIADAATDKLYMADGVIYGKRRRPAMGNKPSRYYFAVCSNDYVIEMPGTLYATNADGKLGLPIDAQENINYIDILSGDIYAWDDYATQFSLLTGQIVTPDDVLLVRYYSNEYNMTNEMSNVFASVKTAGEYAVIMYATTSGISESYTLMVKESASNNNITQVCTNGDVRYSRIYANGKWGLWSKKENAYKSDIANGELTVKVNGMKAGKFTANQFGNTELKLDDKNFMPDFAWWQKRTANKGAKVFVSFYMGGEANSALRLKLPDNYPWNHGCYNNYDSTVIAPFDLPFYVEVGKSMQTASFDVTDQSMIDKGFSYGVEYIIEIDFDRLYNADQFFLENFGISKGDVRVFAYDREDVITHDEYGTGCYEEVDVLNKYNAKGELKSIIGIDSFSVNIKYVKVVIFGEKEFLIPDNRHPHYLRIYVDLRYILYDSPKMNCLGVSQYEYIKHKLAKSGGMKCYYTGILHCNSQGDWVVDNYDRHGEIRIKRHKLKVDCGDDRMYRGSWREYTIPHEQHCDLSQVYIKKMVMRNRGRKNELLFLPRKLMKFTPCDMVSKSKRNKFSKIRLFNDEFSYDSIKSNIVIRYFRHRNKGVYMRIYFLAALVGKGDRRAFIKSKCALCVRYIGRSMDHNTAWVTSFIKYIDPPRAQF